MESSAPPSCLRFEATESAGKIAGLHTASPPWLPLEIIWGGLRSPVAQPTHQTHHIRICRGGTQALRCFLESSPKDSNVQSV